MNETLLSILGVYSFIAVGFFSKTLFKDKISEKGLVLLSVYFLQPFLVFWGLTKKEIDLDLALTPAIFFVSMALIAVFIYAVFGLFFKDRKDLSILSVASVVGNTGNLGIPLGIALFGEESIPYTTLINLANVFLVYSFGVYFYSRGKNDALSSLINIFKLPILWFAVLAILFNLSGAKLPQALEEPLKMGAYSSIVLQLIIFGAYLREVKIESINTSLQIGIVAIKFVLIPAVMYFIVDASSIEPMAKGVLFMEIIVPLAITNVNLSALYECKPKEVTAAVFTTSVLFLGLIFLYMPLIKRLTNQ